MKLKIYTAAIIGDIRKVKKLTKCKYVKNILYCFVASRGFEKTN